MRYKQPLYFRGVHVDPARDDHEVLSISEIEVALLIQITHVANGSPTSGVKGLVSLPGFVEVFEACHLGKVDLTHFAYRQLLEIIVENFRNAGQWPADRPRMVKPILRVD